MDHIPECAMTLQNDLADKIKIVANKVSHVCWSADYQLAALRAAMMHGDVFSFICFDHVVKLFLPFAGSDWIQQKILIDGGFYEFALLKEMRKEIPRGAVVVDAGGNIGNHSCFFSLFCNASVIHVFEPQRIAFGILKRNMELNRCRNVIPHNEALGSAPGQVSFVDQMIANCGSLSFVPAEMSENSYPATTVDLLGLDRLDFMKIDVEGAEYGVLCGAEQTISKFHPTIFMEFKPDAPAYAQTKEFLDRNGYVLARQFGINCIFKSRS